jgi:hypothetical protein
MKQSNLPVLKKILTFFVSHQKSPTIISGRAFHALWKAAIRLLTSAYIARTPRSLRVLTRIFMDDATRDRGVCSQQACDAIAQWAAAQATSYVQRRKLIGTEPC